MPTAKSTAQPFTAWPAEYVICIRGHIDPVWSEWLGNLAVVHTASGDTLLAGQVIDVSALRSLLTRIFDMHLLLLVKRKDHESI